MRECTSVTPGFSVFREITRFVVTGPAHATVPLDMTMRPTRPIPSTREKSLDDTPGNPLLKPMRTSLIGSRGKPSAPFRGRAHYPNR